MGGAVSLKRARTYGNCYKVLRIRIRMFLGLPDPHPDPLVTSTDPALDPQTSSKNSKKPLISTVL
jgi:hypothetical protein